MRFADGAASGASTGDGPRRPSSTGVIAMEMLKRPLAVILGLMAIGVLLHFVFSPFYEELVDTVTIWHILNWIMAAGVIITLITTCIQKKRS